MACYHARETQYNKTLDNGWVRSEDQSYIAVLVQTAIGWASAISNSHWRVPVNILSLCLHNKTADGNRARFWDKRFYWARSCWPNHVRSHRFCDYVFDHPPDTTSLTGKARLFSFERLRVALDGGELMLITEIIFTKMLTNYYSTIYWQKKGFIISPPYRVVTALGGEPEPIMTFYKYVCPLSGLPA